MSDSPQPITRLRAWLRRPARVQRVRTPTVLQMEAVECGAAALAIVLGYHGRLVPLEELRLACGVSRDGSKASNMVKAARTYGLKAKGFSKEPAALRAFPLPQIVFWNFNHFLVVEGFGPGRVYLNDPATGPRVVADEEFNQSFTGVVLIFEPGPEFQPGGVSAGMLGDLRQRLAGTETALAYVLLVTLALIIPGLAIPAFARIFLDQVLATGLRGWITPLLIGMGLTATLRAALTWLQQTALLRLETRLALGGSGRFFWHVLHLPVEFFSQRYAGEICARVAINDRLAALLSGDLATAVLSLVLVVFYALLMFQYDALLTSIGVGVALLNIGVLRAIARRRVDTSRQLQADRGKLLGTAYAGLEMIETLKATGVEPEFFARWSGYHAKVVNAEQRLAVFSQTLAVVPPLLATLNTVAILVIGSLRIMDGRLTVGMLVAFQSLMSSFLQPIDQLVRLGGTMQEIEAEMSRVADVLRYPRDSQATARPDSPPTVALSGHIELRNVTFGFSHMAPPLLENLNLTIRPGQRVALVGGSGSGKSTVAKLVTGLYAPWSGEILFDGQPRSTLGRATLAGALAFVDQEIVLFEGTLRENLALWDDRVAEETLVAAARDAVIHDLIMSRPGGYAAQIEGCGRDLSGGQRQQIEIARALVGDPRILVLDEATSALDPLTEQTLDGNLRRRGCTCLIVAHRLSTIRDADEILVMECGQIVERGTHAQLLGAGGHYTRLIQADAPPNSAAALDSFRGTEVPGA